MPKYATIIKDVIQNRCIDYFQTAKLHGRISRFCRVNQFYIYESTNRRFQMRLKNPTFSTVFAVNICFPVQKRKLLHKAMDPSSPVQRP